MRRSLRIAAISADAKEKAAEVGFDAIQSALLEIANEDGSTAQLAKIEELVEQQSTKATEEAENEESEDRKGDDYETDNESDSDAYDLDKATLVPKDSADEASDEKSDGTDARGPNANRKAKERLFAALKQAWEKAPKSVRERFLVEIVKMDPKRVKTILAD